MAKAGHSNSGENVDGIAADCLKSFVERIENLEVEKKETSNSIKDVYAEAKGTGFDAKIIRRIIAERKREKDDLREERELMDLYRHALGMDTESDEGEL